VILLVSMVAAAPLTQDSAVLTARNEQITQARLALAREDFAAAIGLLEQADATNPDDPEILRLLGSAYAFDRRYPQAIATLRRALILAPDDMDIRAALARAHLWSGDRRAAQIEVAGIEDRSPGSADAAAIRQQLEKEDSSIEEAGRRWGFAAAQSFSHVTFANRPSRTWADTSFAVFGNVGRETAISFGVEREDRRTATDTRFEARLDQQFGSALRGYVAVAATPNANFREKWGVTGGIEADVASFATLLADIRHAEYQDASVTVFQPGMRLTVRKLGVNATVRMINLWDEDGTHRSGVSGRVDKAFSSGVTLFAGAATYPDTEAGITRQVHSLFAGGTVPLTQKVSLRAGVDYDRRRETYKRKGASLGIQVRF
jgi:YaiO family outer membrane protein